MTFLSSLLVAASMAVGQPANPTDPHLKDLARLVGQWHVEAELEDVEFTRLNVVYRFVLDGKFLEATWRDMAGKHVGTEVFAWDPAAKTVKMWSFDPTALIEATWLCEGDKWSAQYDVIRPSGERVRDLLQMKFEDDNNLSLKVTRAGTGESAGTATFKRQGLGQAASRKDFAQLRKIMQGRWVNTDDTLPSLLGLAQEGTTPTTYVDIKVVADGNALDETYYAGDGIGKALTFWDAAHQRIKMHAVFSNGSVWEAVTYKKGGMWMREVTLDSIAGKRVTLRGSFTVSDDGNTQTWTNPDTDKRNTVRRVNRLP